MLLFCAVVSTTLRRTAPPHSGQGTEAQQLSSDQAMLGIRSFVVSFRLPRTLRTKLKAERSRLNFFVRQDKNCKSKCVARGPSLLVEIYCLLPSTATGISNRHTLRKIHVVQAGYFAMILNAQEKHRPVQRVALQSYLAL